MNAEHRSAHYDAIERYRFALREFVAADGQEHCSLAETRTCQHRTPDAHTLGQTMRLLITRIV